MEEILLPEEKEIKQKKELLNLEKRMKRDLIRAIKDFNMIED
jgi:hypothetical protein